MSDWKKRIERSTDNIEAKLYQKACEWVETNLYPKWESEGMIGYSAEVSLSDVNVRPRHVKAKLSNDGFCIDDSQYTNPAYFNVYLKEPNSKKESKSTTSASKKRRSWRVEEDDGTAVASAFIAGATIGSGSNDCGDD